MESKKIKQALIGGIIATAIITMFMLVAPMIGMPDMKIGNMMAGFHGNTHMGRLGHALNDWHCLGNGVCFFGKGQIHVKSGFKGNAICHFTLDADATDGDANDGHGCIFGELAGCIQNGHGYINGAPGIRTGFGPFH